MDARYMSILWNVDAFDGCEVQCPECKKWSKVEDWREGEIGCDICDTHFTAICPKCEAYFDAVYSPKFEVRDGKQ